MDILTFYRQTIERIMKEYASIPYSGDKVQREVVFDRENDHYLLMAVGWDNPRRIHGCLLHVDIIDDKIWVQYDGTEESIALDLVAAGIPKEQIVLGFHPAEIRPHTEFAVA